MRPLEGMHLGGRREVLSQCLWGQGQLSAASGPLVSPLPPSRLQPLSLLTTVPVPLRQLQMEACRDERSSDPTDVCP